MKNKWWLVVLVLFYCGAASWSPAQAENAVERANTARKVPVETLRISPGFQLEIYSNNVPEARQMALGDKGTVFVGSTKSGIVYALVDKDKNSVADDRYIVAVGLNQPSGLAFKDGALYVAESNRIIRFDNVEDNLLAPQGFKVIVDDLPVGKDWNELKYLGFGPDGKLYFPIGAPCNVCENKDERYGTIMRMNPDGSELEIFAKGVRNSLGFDWHPQSKEFWFTDNGRDLMGMDLPPDELNKAPKAGMDFGFPYCHGKEVADPEFNTKKCTDFTPAERELLPHSGAGGMKFYTGEMFPPDFQNRYIMVAEHGYWNKDSVNGYRVAVIEVINNAAAYYASFIDGWKAETGNTEAWGRPVDILQLKDGSLLVSDDLSGAIYRASF